MRDVVVAGLRECDWNVTVSDLHAQQFTAVASAQDFPERDDQEYLVYSLEQRRSSFAEDIVREVCAVSRADLLVLVFPLFWYSVPAQMKGWIDRVFLSGLFYGGRRIYDRAGMAVRRALVVVSLGGHEHMFGPEAIHGDLCDMLRHVLQGTLGYVGYSVYRPFFAYHVPYVNEAARQRILLRLRQAIANLDSRERLTMPSLTDFDKSFRPYPKVTRPTERDKKGVKLESGETPEIVRFDTKIAVVVREDLAVWQKLNVTALSGITGQYPDILGEPYFDTEGRRFNSLCKQPIICMVAEANTLRLIHLRAIERDIQTSAYTEEMFATGHDGANRDVFGKSTGATANIGGIAVREARKKGEKIIDGARMHG